MIDGAVERKPGSTIMSNLYMKELTSSNIEGDPLSRASALGSGSSACEVSTLLTDLEPRGFSDSPLVGPPSQRRIQTGGYC